MCSINYKYIIKFEELEQEERMLMKILGMENKFPPMFLKMKSGRENATERYLKMLTKEDCLKLTKVYSKDIAGFGYTKEVDKIIHDIFD